MNPAWRKYLSMRAPRYTSYPSALEFTKDISADDFANALHDITLYEPLSIYVHIPFCRALCWYCGCNMKVETRSERAAYYVNALIDEIAHLGELLGAAGRPSEVHFGGGTPNFFRPKKLSLILSAIESHLGLTDQARLAIELDPRLIDEGDPQEYAAMGVSRISLGVQDFDPVVQAAINRVQPFHVVEACVRRIRRAGVSDLAVDLLYGLPHQSMKSFARTISQSLLLGPDRVSLFGYAHLPDAMRHQRLIDEKALPDAALRHELAELGEDMLLDAGYERIGFDHFARPGNALALAARENRLRRNFQGFSDDVAETTIGLGASAISYVRGLYVQNCKDARGYAQKVSAGGLATARGVRRSAVDETVAAAIGALLCTCRTDLSPLRAVVSHDICERVEMRISELVKEGVVRRRGGVIELADEAHHLSRAVAAMIDPRNYADAPLSRAV